MKVRRFLASAYRLMEFFGKAISLSRGQAQRQVIGPIEVSTSEVGGSLRIKWLNRMTQSSSEVFKDGTRYRINYLINRGGKILSYSRMYDTSDEAATAFLLNLDLTRTASEHSTQAQRQVLKWLNDSLGTLDMRISKYARANRRRLNADVLIGSDRGTKGVLVYLSPGGRKADVIVDGRLQTLNTENIWYS